MVYIRNTLGYIKQEDAIRALDDHAESTHHNLSIYPNILNEHKEVILDIPPADVRPVVYCKDCKWYRESELLAPNRFCFRLKDKNGKPVGYNFADMDFCSHGERRDADMKGEQNG